AHKSDRFRVTAESNHLMEPGGRHVIVTGLRGRESRRASGRRNRHHWEEHRGCSGPFAKLGGRDMSLPTSITAIIGGILGFAVVVALSLIVGGRFAMSDGFRLNDTFGGVFVVDRFTGAT